MAKARKPVDFESAIDALEELVEHMEQGELSLEESVKQFERGIELAKTCQKALKDAEQRVQKLSNQDTDDETLEEFSEEDNE